MERKLATVLFVDLVGSSALVAGSDPEVVRRRVTRFFDQVSRCVTTHGGIVEKFAGDAVLAAFGVAQAHEDDAERAVRAGIGILEAVVDLELEARIGIESGEVVVDTTESARPPAAWRSTPSRSRRSSLSPSKAGANRFLPGVWSAPQTARGLCAPPWSRR